MNNKNAFGRKKSKGDNLITDLFDMAIMAVAALASLIWLAWKFHRDEIVERRRLFIGLSVMFVVCLLGRFFFLEGLADVLGMKKDEAIHVVSLLPLALLPYLAIRFFVTPWVSSGLVDEKKEYWLVTAFFCLCFALPFGLYSGITTKSGVSFADKAAKVYGRAGQSLEANIRAFFFDPDYLLKVTRNAMGRLEHASSPQRLIETVNGRPNKKFWAKPIVKPSPNPQPFFYLLWAPLWMGFWFSFWVLALGDRLINKEARESQEALGIDPLDEAKSIPTAKKRGPKIPVDQLNRHSLTVGTTGAGKTSFMLYMAKELLRRNFGLMFIDPKSDPANLELLSSAAHALGRELDLVALELGHSKKSATYNPLLRGNPSMLTDKIMTSTDWSEAYYEKKAREALLLVFSALESRHFCVSFHDLYLLLTNPQVMRHLADDVDEPFLKKSLLGLSGQLKDLTGLTSYLLNLDVSFPQTNTYSPNLDLLDAYLAKKVVYVGLSVNAFRDTSKIFGRLLFTDLQATTAMIQSEKIKPRPFGVFIDEAGSVLTQGSVDWLNKCRSAGFLACLGVQSLADMDTVSPTFKTQVMANTNNLFVFRPNDHEGTEMLAMTFGTKDTIKRTEAYDDLGLNSGRSEREVKEFHIAPDTIKELPNGRAAVLIRGNRITRGVWDLHRIHGQEGTFDDLLPHFRSHVPINKRGFDAERLIRGTKSEEGEELKQVSPTTMSNGKTDSVLSKPKLELA